MDENYNTNSFVAGQGEMYNMKMFISLGLVAYLLVKAAFGPFGIYPKKYYNQTMTINSNSANNQEQIINAYVPGIWNNEMTDIITFIVLFLVIFMLKTKNNLVVYSNKPNYYLLISIMVACCYPPLKQNFSTDPSSMNLFEKIMIPILLILGFIFNFMSSAGQNKFYLLYLGFIVIIFVGLYLSKSNSEMYQDVLYNVASTNNQTKCTSYDTQEITVKSSGTVFKLTTVFVLFLSIIALPYNNNIITNVINGLLIGCFIGMMSFYGFQYPFYRTPADFCKNEAECQKKNIPTDNGNTYDAEISSEVENKVNWNSWTIMSVALVMVLMLFYLSFQR